MKANGTVYIILHSTSCCAAMIELILNVGDVKSTSVGCTIAECGLTEAATRIGTCPPLYRGRAVTGEGGID